MTTALKPTKSRVQILRAIRDTPGKVYSCLDYVTGQQVSYWRTKSGDRLVKKRCDEMAAARWIATGAASGPSMYARRPWELTDLGREILAQES